MLTQDEWDEARDYWTHFLDSFEKEIYPVFAARGFSRNTALQVYALACSPTTIDEENDSGDEWKTRQ